MRRLGVFLLVLLTVVPGAAAPAAATAASAAAEEVRDFTAAVPGLPGKTWLDLMRQVFPTIAPWPPPEYGAFIKYSEALPDIRGIDGEPFSAGCRNPMPLDGLYVQRVVIADKRRLIVAPTDNEGCFAPVALFAADDGKLLDVADFKQDENTFFGDSFVRRVGSSGQLVMAENTHESSEGGYQIYTLALASADRLIYIGSTFTHNEVDCRKDIWRKATIRLISGKAGMAAIVGDIETTVKHKTADCSTPQGRDRISRERTIWLWDGATGRYRQER